VKARLTIALFATTVAARLLPMPGYCGGISDATALAKNLLYGSVFREKAGIGRGEAVRTVRRAGRAGNDEECGTLVLDTAEVRDPKCSRRRDYEREHDNGTPTPRGEQPPC